MTEPTVEEIVTGRRAASPEDVAKIERDHQERLDWRRTFLTGLMSSADFREWLMRVLVDFGTFENSFGAGPSGAPDPMATMFAMGMRQAGWRLWTTFDDAAPELTSQMRRDWSKPG